jgi:hypothetical protein
MKEFDMKLNATISLTPIQVMEILCDYLSKNGVTGVSHQDIGFIINEVEKGNQRDSYKVAELTEVKIKNIKIGE